MVSMTTLTLRERFNAKFKRRKPNKCWPWSGCKIPGGYGQIWDGTKMVNAHRIAYLFEHGEIPAGKVIRHACDNPACVNPSHLIAGTNADNTHDMVARDRNSHVRGSSHPLSKLTYRDIEFIRASKDSNRKTAKSFNVSHTLIGKIRRRETWKHIK